MRERVISAQGGAPTTQGFDIEQTKQTANEAKLEYTHTHTHTHIHTTATTTICVSLKKFLTSWRFFETTTIVKQFMIAETIERKDSTFIHAPTPFTFG